MRRFKGTPQKKFIGMLILFVFIPLFLLWYVVFFLDKKPSTETMIILGLVAVLALFLYWKYKKQLRAIAQAGQTEESFEDRGLGQEENDMDEDNPEEDKLDEAVLDEEDIAADDEDLGGDDETLEEEEPKPKQKSANNSR